MRKLCFLFFFPFFVFPPWQQSVGSAETHQISLIHAVDVWPDHCEVLEPLRRGGIRNVYNHSQVVTYRANLAFKGTWQGALRELELKAELVVPAWHYGNDAILAFI